MTQLFVTLFMTNLIKNVHFISCNLWVLAKVVF